MDQRISVHRTVINLVIAEVREAMQALCTMNEAQERFFDYMVGESNAAGEPPITLIQKFQVADSFLHVVDGFPIARTFDPFCFPAFRIAHEVVRQRDRLIVNYGRPRSHRGRPQPGGKRARRTPREYR